jgi:hypothetical protein
MATGDRFGAGKFLRREVLGRRLTRSARAVIVPDPRLRIDEIGVPRDVLDQMLEGLDPQQRALSESVVLVNRNPTLHRFGVLAMRPRAYEDGARVFRLPLAVLQALGADFDGDEASIVALETREAIEECERLMTPGCAELRNDEYHRGAAAFRLAKELSDPGGEDSLAACGYLDDETWRATHAALVEQRLRATDGWPEPFMSTQLGSISRAVDKEEWLERAAKEMAVVYRGVRAKPRLGGVLRRQLYAHALESPERFRECLRAIQAVTERATQSALSVKGGEGAARFDAGRYFENPSAKAYLQPSPADERDPAIDLAALDTDRPLNPEALARDLTAPCDPAGLLAWLASPTAVTLLRIRERLAEGEGTAAVGAEDPRVGWFLG